MSGCTKLHNQLGGEQAAAERVCYHLSSQSTLSVWMYLPKCLSLFQLISKEGDQFSSVAQSSPTLCNPMNHSMPGLPVHHQLLEFTQIHVQWVGDAIQPSHPVIPFSSCPQSFPASRSSQMSQLFASGGQSIGVSASASVLPMNILD